MLSTTLSGLAWRWEGITGGAVVVRLLDPPNVVVENDTGS